MATTKKHPAKKTTKKPAVVQRSFVRSSETEPFFTFRATHQTVYWIIICLLVLAIGVWVLHLTLRVNDLYNNVQVRNADLHILPKHN